ncbi:uncharacterized protein [Watersipora subatra]|uniref:uncharacterized protein n=1 Tax=Watersipora subatra TaxID=2589382 RepID=UPI00355C09C8
MIEAVADGEKRDLELKIVSADDIIVNSNQHPVVPHPLQPPLSHLPPKSITLLRSIKLSSQPVSVCQHEGVTYVGLYNGTVIRIDSNYNLHDSFISPPGIVESICIYENRLYILSYKSCRRVSVYEVSGQMVTTWRHPYHGYNCSMLTVAAGNVVVADPRNKRLTIYSLTGETQRNVSCPLLSNNPVSICAGHDDDVIIADYETQKVFKFNIITGDVMWTFTQPDPPQGLVRYGDYILVAAYNRNIIFTLSYATGEKVSEMRGDGIGKDNIDSLSVTGNTLVVPQWSENKVFFYELSEKVIARDSNSAIIRALYGRRMLY